MCIFIHFLLLFLIKVALENPKDTTIRFGAVKVGKNCSRTFCLINKSLAPVNLLVGFSDQLPVNGIYLAKPQENFTDLGIDHRLLGTMSVVPSKVFTIKPQETFPITLIYTPVKVCCNFSETVSQVERTEYLTIVKRIRLLLIKIVLFLKDFSSISRKSGTTLCSNRMLCRTRNIFR